MFLCSEVTESLLNWKELNKTKHSHQLVPSQISRLHLMNKLHMYMYMCTYFVSRCAYKHILSLIGVKRLIR